MPASTSRQRAPLFGESGTKINFLSHFFDGSADNAAYQALQGLEKDGATVDLFTNDGFVAGQMIVRALEASGTDADKMVAALEGWSFGPGTDAIRAEDHASGFQRRSRRTAAAWSRSLVNTLDAAAVAPPVTPFK